MIDGVTDNGFLSIHGPGPLYNIPYEFNIDFVFYEKGD